MSPNSTPASKLAYMTATAYVTMAMFTTYYQQRMRLRLMERNEIVFSLKTKYTLKTWHFTFGIIPWH